MSRIRIAAVLAALALAPAAAHAQSTITACYVPKTGSVYRIQAPGAPEACKNGHTEFSWETAGAGLPGYQIRSSTPAAHDAGFSAGHHVACQAGEVPVGGGYFINPTSTFGVAVTSSGPTTVAGSGLKGWAVSVANSSAVQLGVTVYAICVQAGA